MQRNPSVGDSEIEISDVGAKRLRIGQQIQTINEAVVSLISPFTCAQIANPLRAIGQIRPILPQTDKGVIAQKTVFDFLG